MKLINFVETVPEEYEREYTLWLIVSIFMITVVCVIMSVIEVRQLGRWRTAHAENQSRLQATATCEREAEHVKKVDARHAELKEKVATISAYARKNSQAVSRLKGFHAACSTGTRLASLMLAHEQATVVIICTTLEDVHRYSTSLAHDADTFGTVALTSITCAAGKGITATFTSKS